ncbi:putative reverse transcriptase domain-containing protein [Tanacetum coccineum]
MSSSSSHAIVTYTSVSTDSDLQPWGFHLIEPEAPESAPQSHKEAPPSPVPAPAYPEYLVPSDDEAPAEDQPLLADASPTVDSPGYIADSKPIEDDFEEDLEMDPVDYANDDEEEEEESSDNDEEEEEHLALADSLLPIPDYVSSSEETTRLRRVRISVRPHTPPSPSAKARIIEYAAAPTPPSPPPSLLSPLSSPLPLIPSPPLLLPSPTRRDAIPEADMPPWKRTCFTALSHRFEIEESSAAAAARQIEHALTRSVDYGFIDTLDASIRATDKRVMTALEEVNERMTDLAATHRALQRDVSVLQRQRIDDGDRLTSHIQHEHDRFRELARTREAGRQDGPSDAGSSSSMALGSIMAPKKTTTPMTDATIKQMIAQGVADALAEYEANRSSGNGDDSHDSGSARRTERTTRECTYSDFLKCQPLNSKGTEGVIGLTQWFEKMESVFHISNCTVACQIKFATCTMLGSELTWWNSHVKTVGHDAAYGMTWKTLMKMMTDNYCPRGEIKKLEIEIWNLKVKGTDVVDKYVGGRPDMIQGSVMASKPKTIQEAIKIANDLIDQKPYKRQNVVRAYAAGSGGKKEYDLYHCAPSATTITLGRVLPSAITAKGLAIWPVIVEALQLLLTTREPLRRFRRLLLVMNVESKGISRKIS